MTDRRGDWMQTFTGRQFWPLDPRAEEVDLVDIAHHLSLICRYCGASRRMYSVAEHSLGVLYVGMREAMRRNPLAQFNSHVEIAFLTHDFAEAYCHDLIRPIKRNVNGYGQIERGIAACIHVRMGTYLIDISAFDHLVKLADNAMLFAERDEIMSDCPYDGWGMCERPPEAMIADGRRFLRRNRWFFWRKWSWWNKRRLLREMKRLRLV